MLTKKQFDVLVCLEENKVEKLSQRRIAEMSGRSVGSVNQVFNELKELKLMGDGVITDAGLDALEPYRAKRAVFLAAGFGSRLVPITLNSPKPLVRVKGTRIIDTSIDACLAAGISEIYLVRGYLGELFEQLHYKYPTIQYIENPIYNESQTISSAMCARNHLENAYILEADMMFYNPKVIRKYQYSSCYVGYYAKSLDDWCLFVKNGVITGMSMGGENCYRMFGLSYWTKEDGARLAGHIKTVFEAPGGKERLWDQVPLEYFQKEYTVMMQECDINDIVEIDTFEELKQIDPSYR